MKFEAPAPAGWYVAAYSTAVDDVPVAVTLNDTPLVLFRTEDRVVHALVDFCPHRGAPLSMGKRVGNTLQCAYHGWCFSGDGQCQNVPSLVSQSQESLKSREAQRRSTKEQQGFIWVYSGAFEDAEKNVPFTFPYLDDKKYAVVHQCADIEGPLWASLENALDVPHTAFLHGGLFRTSTQANLIQVDVKVYPRKCEAHYIGEPRPKGLGAKLLAPGGGEVRHVDRFLWPSISQVEYQLGASTHLVTTTAMVPLKANLTRLFSVVTYKTPWPKWLIRAIATPIGLKILNQDAHMLKAMTQNHQRFPNKEMTSTQLDALGPQIQRLFREAQNERDSDTLLHSHSFKMKV